MATSTPYLIHLGIQCSILDGFSGKNLCSDTCESMLTCSVLYTWWFYTHTHSYNMVGAKPMTPHRAPNS